MARRQYKIPFAATGDVVSVPDAVQPDGSVSLQQGYGFDYQRDPDADPLAKLFPRDVHNGILNEITASIGEIQQQGYPIWATAGAPYQINAVVRHNDMNWQSKIATNNDEPGVGPGATSWASTSEGQVISGQYRNLSATAVGTNAVLSITADQFVVATAGGLSKTLSAVSTSVNLATTGAGGRDSGSLVGSTWYAVYIIHNPTTNTTSAIASTNYTTPALPSGFTQFGRVTSVRSNSGGTQLLPMTKGDVVVSWSPAPGTGIPSDFPLALSNGASLTPVAVSLAAFVPPNSKNAHVAITQGAANTGAFLLSKGPAGAASGLLAQTISNGPAVQRVPVLVPRGNINPPYYNNIVGGVGTVIVMGWDE